MDGRCPSAEAASAGERRMQKIPGTRTSRQSPRRLRRRGEPCSFLAAGVWMAFAMHATTAICFAESPSRLTLSLDIAATMTAARFGLPVNLFLLCCYRVM